MQYDNNKHCTWWDPWGASFTLLLIIYGNSRWSVIHYLLFSSFFKLATDWDLVFISAAADWQNTVLCKVKINWSKEIVTWEICFVASLESAFTLNSSVNWMQLVESFSVSCSSCLSWLWFLSFVLLCSSLYSFDLLLHASHKCWNKKKQWSDKIGCKDEAWWTGKTAWAHFKSCLVWLVKKVVVGWLVMDIVNLVLCMFEQFWK